MADDQSTFDRLKETFVYAPLGFALYARDTAPGFVRLFVARGRGALEGQRQSVDANLDQARSIGEFAFRKGGPMARQRFEEGIGVARAAVETALGSVLPTPDSPPPDAARVDDLIAGVDEPDTEIDLSEPEPATPTRPAPSPAFLPIPEYDDLSASQVVERLDGLGYAELSAIADYETATRGRRTILGKIEQLTV